MALKSFRWFVLPSFFCLFSITSWASFSAVPGVGVRGDTLQAFTGLANDPSAIYYNPGGLTQVKGTEVDASAAYIMPKLRYVNSNNDVETQSTRKAIDGDLFLSHQMNDQWTVGFGFYVPFGGVSRNDKNAATSNLNVRANLVRYDLVPTVAFRFNPYISAGLGFVASYEAANQDILGLHEYGGGYGYTGQGGVLFSLPSRGLRLGFVYRAPEIVLVHGTGTGAGNEDFFRLRDRYPGTAGVGASWQINPAWLVSVAADYEMWSFVNQVKREYHNAVLNAAGTTVVDGKDTLTLRAGVMYTLRKVNELRVGLAHSPAAVPARNISPAKPDYNTNLLTLGYSRYFRSQWRFDFGYEFAFAPWRRAGIDNSFPGKYKFMANVVMAGLAYRFGAEAPGTRTVM